MKFAAFLTLFVLMGAVFVAAAAQASADGATDAQAQSVESAVASAISNPTTPPEPSGFIDGRLNDIQKRVGPVAGRANAPNGFGQGFGRNGPGQQGGQPPFGPGFDDGANRPFGPQGSGGFGNGGPRDDFGGGPRDFGPQGKIGGPGFSEEGSDDFGPQGGFGGPGFGPQENVGPGIPQGGFGGRMDFRGFGQFNLPAEAIEGMIFSQIGDALDEKYGKDNLLKKCGNQQELVTLVQEELQKSGVNLQTEVCSEIEQGVSYCSEAKNQCEQIGQDQGPGFGPDGEEFKPSCPPNESEWKAMCVKRFQSEMEQGLQERNAEVEANCREHWQYDRPPDDACVNGQPRQPMECDKQQWINQCMANQPLDDDFGPGPNEGFPQGPNGPGQPWQQPPQGQNGQSWNQPPNQGPWQQPPQGQQPQCVPINDEMKNACINAGQAWTVITNANQCPQVVCTAGGQGTATATSQPTTTPVTETIQATAAPTAPPQATPAPAESTPAPSIQAAAGPFSGFVTARMGPQERCETEWSRNAPRFEKRCQQMQSQKRGPQFNFCNEQEFLNQCMAESQKRMEEEKKRRDPEKICAYQVQRDLRNFARYCKDIGQGKERCLKETERGCDFGKKQLEKCKVLTSSDNVRKAIEHAVARECRKAAGQGGSAGMNKLRDLVPSDYKSLVDYESDNVEQAQERAKAVDQKDFGYALTQLIGLQAEQEKKDAEALKEQSDRLGKTIERLQALTDQVESADAKIVLEAQIADLQQQKETLDGRAKSKESGASGIFSILTNLLGGGK